MKRVFSFISAIILCVGLVGCGHHQEQGDKGSFPSPAQNGSESIDTSHIQKIIMADYSRAAVRTEFDEEAIPITDEGQITEILDALSAIEWTPKTEGDWPKYSVNLPDYRMEIQTSDGTSQINLFDERYAAVLTGDDWQRYEISTSDYETLKQFYQ